MAPQSVISTTLQLLRDKLVDNSFLSHPLFRAIEGAGNLVKVSGGLRGPLVAAADMWRSGVQNFSPTSVPSHCQSNIAPVLLKNEA